MHCSPYANITRQDFWLCNLGYNLPPPRVGPWHVEKCCAKRGYATALTANKRDPTFLAHS
ncbi:hypothetical protein COAQ111491_16365 [Comamonas aquatilis]